MALATLNGAITMVLLAGGGGAAVAFGLFRYLGGKWLDDRFASRLEMLRHENAKDTERLKRVMSQQLDRATKLSQREFDALSDLWGATVDAVLATRGSYTHLIRTSDLSKMEDQAAEEYLVRLGVSDHHRREILSEPASSRNNLLGRSLSLKALNEAGRLTMDALRLFRRASIFLPENLREGFDDLLNLTRDALVDIEMRNEERMSRSDLPDAERLRGEGDNLLKELEEMVRIRLATLPSEET